MGRWRTSDGETLAELAATADGYGFDIIGMADHVWQNVHIGGIALPQLECFTMLGVVTAPTLRVRLTPLVLAESYRPPAIIAKGITTLDVLSGGRAMLGIGSGYCEEEASGLGLPFPRMADRFALLEETLQVCLHMWCGDQGDNDPFPRRACPSWTGAECSPESCPPPADSTHGPHEEQGLRATYHSGGWSTGSRRVKVLPAPSVLVTRIWPPCCATICCAPLRPMPEP